MRKYLWTIAILIAFTLSLTAGSIFSTSRYGVGIRQYQTSVRGLGMGNTGLALQDYISLNTNNISTWRFLVDTRISISFFYLRSSLEYKTEKWSSSIANFNTLQLAVPLKQKRMAVGFSIIPYTLVNFRYAQKFSSDISDFEETVLYDGIISRAQFNFAWAPLSWLGLGASFHYYFGNIEDKYYLSFDQPSMYDSEHKIEYQFYGPGAGVSFNIEPLDSFMIGGFVDFKPRLTFRRAFESPVSQETQESNAKSTFPLSWGVGTSFHLTKQIILSADYTTQYWSQGFNIPGFDTSQLEDWYNYGFGIEHLHSRERKKSFFNKLDWRTGFSAGNIGYKFHNNSVKEYRVHFGIGIPFFFDNNRLDIALVGGVRGDKSVTIAQEKFIKIYLSLSAGELWFQKIR